MGSPASATATVIGQRLMSASHARKSNENPFFFATSNEMDLLCGQLQSNVCLAFPYVRGFVHKTECAGPFTKMLIFSL